MRRAGSIVYLLHLQQTMFKSSMEQDGCGGARSTLQAYVIGVVIDAVVGGRGLSYLFLGLCESQ